MDDVVDDVFLSTFTIGLLHLGVTLIVPSSTRKRHESTWFLMHAFVNAIIAWQTFPCVVALLTHPSSLYQSPHPLIGGRFPICLAINVHVYHMAMFEMRREDLLHHGVFLPTIAIPGYLFHWGDVGNLQLFFICGLPGFVISVRCRRGDTAPSDTQPIKNAVVVATAGRATSEVTQPSFILHTRDKVRHGGRPDPRRSSSELVSCPQTAS